MKKNKLNFLILSLNINDAFFFICTSQCLLNTFDIVIDMTKNCITHVMIILGPCRNNAFFLKNKFQVCTLFLCVHVLCVLGCAHMLNMLPNCSRQMQVAHS